MKRIEAAVNNRDYQKILKYCKEHHISIYKLVNDAVFERMEKEK